MYTDLNEFVPDVIFEKIPIKNLLSSQNYQRNLSESQILKIAREFDLHQINPVKVSRRNGMNYVFDGQHTIEAVALKSGSRETPVWCMIYDHLSYEFEAHIFAEQQKHHRPVAPYPSTASLYPTCPAALRAPALHRIHNPPARRCPRLLRRQQQTIRREIYPGRKETPSSRRPLCLLL